MTLKPTQITAIKKILNPWLEYHQVHNRWPSLSMGLILNGKVEMTKSWGYADLESEAYATPNTHYRIASISKSFTALLMLKLVDEQKLQLDDYIEKHADISKKLHHKITIRDLLIHASGLSRDGLTSHWSDSIFPDQQDFFEELQHTFQVTQALDEWRYSNFGYAILGVIIENITGMSYQNAIEKQILSPLKLEATSVDRLPSCQDICATGYGLDHPGEERRIFEPIKTLSYAPATGFCSSTKDMCAWMLSLMHNQLNLSNHAIEELFRVQWHHPPSDTSRALGFSIGFNGKYKIISHGGGFQGYSTLIAFMPDDKIGMTLLTNAISQDISRYADSILKIIEHIAAHPPKKSGKYGSLSSYEGTYTNIWGSVELVSLGDRLIAIQLADVHPVKKPIILKPISRQRFIIEKADGYWSRGQEAYMVKNPKGETELYLGSTYFVRSE